MKTSFALHNSFAHIRPFREKVKKQAGIGRASLEVWPDLHIGTVIKRTEKKHVVEITRRMAHGLATQAQRLLQLSQGGTVLNTAFIERFNGTLRERLASLTRKCRHSACRLQALHTGMYLIGCTYNFCVVHQELPFHGSAEERERRLKLLQRVAQGEESYAALLEHPVWERPIDVVVALSGGEAVTLHSLDMVNEGQIPELPHSVFVETPCTVTADGPKPHTVHLPKSVLASCLRTAQISDTIVQAGLQRKRALVHEAIELDPTILDKAAGIQAIDACLQTHADLLPHYT